MHWKEGRCVLPGAQTKQGDHGSMDVISLTFSDTVQLCRITSTTSPPGVSRVDD